MAVDELGFEAWMRQWADIIVRFAHHHGGPWMTAQDVAQETFLRAYRHTLSHGALPSSGWLFRVASRLMIDEYRRQSREVVGDERLQGATYELDIDRQLVVLEALESLSERDRECMALFYFRDWSLEEIARHLKIPSATVRTRLFRARERFRHLWEVSQ